MITRRHARRAIAAIVMAAALLGAIMPEVAAQRSRSPEDWTWNVEEPVGIEGVRHGTIHSTSMDRVVGYNIYLPPGYVRHGERRYPVVYFLHGASGTERSDAGLANVVAAQISSGAVGEVIYVFPNGGQYSGYRDWDDTYVKAETLLMEELIPHIDATYRTIAAREGRAICGFSMGGGAALRLATKHPEMFCAAAGLAGAFGWRPDDGEGEDTVYHWVDEHADAIRGRMGLMMVVGAEDRLHERHGPLVERLDAQKIGFRYEVHAGVGHNLGELTRLSGEDMVRFLAESYSPAQ